MPTSHFDHKYPCLYYLFTAQPSFIPSASTILIQRRRYPEFTTILDALIIIFFPFFSFNLSQETDPAVNLRQHRSLQFGDILLERNFTLTSFYAQGKRRDGVCTLPFALSISCHVNLRQSQVIEWDASPVNWERLIDRRFRRNYRRWTHRELSVSTNVKWLKKWKRSGDFFTLSNKYFLGKFQLRSHYHRADTGNYIVYFLTIDSWVETALLTFDIGLIECPTILFEMTHRMRSGIYTSAFNI